MQLPPSEKAHSILRKRFLFRADHGDVRPRAEEAEEISPAGAADPPLKRTSNKEKLQAAAAHAEAHMSTSHKWRNRRWAVLMLVNLFFVFSFYSTSRSWKARSPPRASSAST
jgi:hypothetical protein